MHNDMTVGKPSKIIFTFAISFLATSALSYVYNITDSLMLAHYVDPSAIGALGSVAPAINLSSMLIVGMIQGFCILIGRTYGSGDRLALRNMSANLILLTVALVLPLTVFTTLFSGNIAVWMGTPDSFLSMTKTYLSVAFAGLPISAAASLLSSFMRALGDGKTPMKISILSGALNVVFNFIFLKIIPLGVAGAAIGSICASIVGIVLYIVFIRTKMSILIPKREDMHLDKSLVKPLLTSGFVMMSQGAIVQVASLVRQIAVNGFDEYVVTGMSTGDKLIYFSWMIIMSFESALIYFAAQNSGAGKISRIKDGWKYTLTVTFVIAALIAALFIGFGKYFYGLFLGFGDDVATVSATEYAGSYVISQMIFFPFMALLSSTRGAVKGMGKNLATVMCGVLELVACALSVLIVNLVPLSQSLKLGVIYLSLPLAWILTSLVVLVLFIRAIKEKREESLLVLNS